MPDHAKILDDMADDILYGRRYFSAPLLQRIEALRAGARAIKALEAQEEEMLP